MYRGILALLILIVLGAGVLYWIDRGGSVAPPTSERIAFVSDRSGHPDIWTMQPDGADARSVTNDAAEDSSPVWSPNARELAFLSDRGGDKLQVYVGAWNGKYDTRLTVTSGVKDMPAWNNDGDELTYLASGRICTMGRRGNTETQYLPPKETATVDNSQTGTPYTVASWNPSHDTMLAVQEMDGAYLAMLIPLGDEPPHSLRDIKRVPLVSGSAVDASWSPMGVQVAAAFNGGDDGNGLAVFDTKAFTREVIYKVSGKNRGVMKPVWSPDGGSVAFEVWEMNEGVPIYPVSLYVIGARGGKATKIVDGQVEGARWSPDGSKLAYSLKGKDGNRDIWVADPNGGNARNLTQGKGDNWSPDWSPTISRGK